MTDQMIAWEIEGWIRDYKFIFAGDFTTNTHS